jgi:hypothetical protein
MSGLEKAWLPYALWMVPLTAVAAFIGTWLMRRVALRGGHIVQPHARGSHIRPTPVGGGMGFVVPVTFAWVGIAIVWDDYVLLATAMVSGALAVMGYIDDRRRIEPWIRLVAQAAAAAIIATLILWRARGPQGIEYAGYIAGAAFMLTWSANLFNFMDGINGLCASESLYVAVAGLAIAAVTGGSTPFLLALVVLAAALVGFLPWNARHAKIFMGDPTRLPRREHHAGAPRARVPEHRAATAVTRQGRADLPRREPAVRASGARRARDAHIPLDRDARCVRGSGRASGCRAVRGAWGWGRLPSATVSVGDIYGTAGTSRTISIISAPVSLRMTLTRRGCRPAAAAASRNRPRLPRMVSNRGMRRQ